MGKIRQSPSGETRNKISETLKQKGCHPPWELSPCYRGGYSRVELFGDEVAEKIRQSLIEANRNREISNDTRRKMSLAKQGDRNINWKGSITDERQQAYNNLETKAWRRAVFARDNYTCQECGDANSYLNAHHIKEVSRYPELRFDIDNGVTLCLSCHKLTDNYGGKWVR